MSRYSDFFLRTPSSVVQLELLELSHPSFSQTYRIVRNAIGGVTVTLEDASVHTFDYYPCQITPAGINDSLDQTMKINFGDLGQILPQEIDNVRNGASALIKPSCIYRTYRSDDLTQPLAGPFIFVLQEISFVKEGSTLTAVASRLNSTSTGELYTVDRFPMLRGFF